MRCIQRQPFVPCASSGTRTKSRTVPKANANGTKIHSEKSRRDALIQGASLLALPLLLKAGSAEAKEVRPGKSLIEVSSLNSFQKKAEKEAFINASLGVSSHRQSRQFVSDSYLIEAAIVTEELQKALTPEDAPDTVRLILSDAGTYDVESGTGGINGSIFLDEELSRPENQNLKPIVDKLKQVRSAIEKRFEKQGFALISYADLEVLAAKVANEKDWAAIKRAQGVPSQGDIISSAFGAAWPVRLGREDATEPDPAGRVPGPDASVKDITTFFAKLGNRDYGATGFFAPKPYFDQRQAFVIYASAQKDIKAAEDKLASDPELGKKYADFRYKYERSRATVTRTDYEVDFIEYLNQLAQQGAKFNPDKYYVPIEIDTPKF